MTGAREGLGFGRDLVVYRAVAGMDVAAAQRLLVYRCGHPGHQRRAGDEHLRATLDDHRVVARCHARSAQAGHRPQRQAYHRHQAHVLGDELPADHLRHIGALVDLERLHRAAAAGAVNQPNDGQAQFVGHLFGQRGLGPDGSIGRPATHREVITLQHDGPAVESATTDQRVAGVEVEEIALVVVAGLARDRADLVKTAGVQQCVDAFSNRQFAAIVLAFDLVRTAHSTSERLAAMQFIDFGLPTHPRRSPGCPPSADFRVGRVNKNPVLIMPQLSLSGLA